MEEENRSCVIGVPLDASTATGFTVDGQVQDPRPPWPPSRLPASTTANSLGRITNSPQPYPAPGYEENTIGRHDIVFLVVAAIGLAAFMAALCSTARSTPEFRLNCLSVSNFNISGSEITSNWDVGFLARNPNVILFCSNDHPILSVFYKNQLLSEAVFPRIHLPAWTRRSFTAIILAMSMKIDDSQVADAIARDWAQGVVAFTVKLLDTRDGNDGKIKLNVTCGETKVGFSNHSSSADGTMLVGLQHSPNRTDHEAFTHCSTFAVGHAA